MSGWPGSTRRDRTRARLHRRRRIARPTGRYGPAVRPGTFRRTGTSRPSYPECDRRAGRATRSGPAHRRPAAGLSRKCPGKCPGTALLSSNCCERGGLQRVKQGRGTRLVDVRPECLIAKCHAVRCSWNRWSPCCDRAQRPAGSTVKSSDSATRPSRSSNVTMTRLRGRPRVHTSAAASWSASPARR